MVRKPSDQASPAPPATITRMPAAIARLKPRSMTRSVCQRSLADARHHRGRERRRRLRRPRASASRLSIDRARSQPRRAQRARREVRRDPRRPGSCDPSAIASISGSRSSQRTSAKLRFEQMAQPPLGAMEVRLHRAHRHVQRLGQILVTHALHVVPVDQHLVRASAAARSPSAGDPSSTRSPNARSSAPAGAAGDRHRPIVERRGRQLRPLLRQHVDRRCDRSTSTASPRRGNTAGPCAPSGTRPAPALRRAPGSGCSARSAQRPGPCTDRPAREMRFHRPAGTARPARARPPPRNVRVAGAPDSGSPSFAHCVED